MTDESQSAERPVVQRRRMRMQYTADGLFLYDTRSDTVYCGNRTAGAVIALLDGTRTWEEIAHMLARRYDQALEGVQVDLAAFASELAAIGLLDKSSWNFCDRPSK